MRRRVLPFSRALHAVPRTYDQQQNIQASRLAKMPDGLNKRQTDEGTNCVYALPTPLIQSSPYLPCGVVPWTCFLSEFHVPRSQTFGAGGLKNRLFPLPRDVAYTTACSYPTSCDGRMTCDVKDKDK